MEYQTRLAAILTDARSVAGGKFSAGVGIFVRSHVGATLLDAFLDDHVLIPSRAVAIWAHAGPRHGFIAASIYLVQGQKFGGDNARHLKRLGQCLRYYAAPYIVGGDWNMPLSQASDARYHE
eukprot:193720-Pyramimonas_sp.AAC.1